MSGLLLPYGYPTTIYAGSEIFGKQIDPTTISVSVSKVVTGGQLVLPNGKSETRAQLATDVATNRAAGKNTFGLGS